MVTRKGREETGNPSGDGGWWVHGALVSVS